MSVSERGIQSDGLVSFRDAHATRNAPESPMAQCFAAHGYMRPPCGGEATITISTEDAARDVHHPKKKRCFA